MGVRTAQDYRAQLQQLLPPGPAWDPELYPMPAIVADAIAAELARVDARAADLLSEMFPGTLRELLSDWERVMGLPDECQGNTASPSGRLREVLRRFSDVGRQDPLYFQEMAQRLGYPEARVIEWRTPRFGLARFGSSQFGSWDCQFVWVVQLGALRAKEPIFGNAQFGDRFGANETDIVECVIRRYAPAHTVVFFDYS